MAAEANAPQLVDVDELVHRLEARGVPQGSWLVDIANVRRALRGADDLMLRMQNAVIAQLPPLEGDDV